MLSYIFPTPRFGFSLDLAYFSRWGRRIISALRDIVFFFLFFFITHVEIIKNIFRSKSTFLFLPERLFIAIWNDSTIMTCWSSFILGPFSSCLCFSWEDFSECGIYDCYDHYCHHARYSLLLSLCQLCICILMSVYF